MTDKIDTIITSLTEYLEVVQAIKNKFESATLAFRGQANDAWALQSGAARRLGASDSITDALFIQYHEDILNQARLKHYEHRQGKSQHDLTLLAALQHHGAATCLIDFTRDALIALWFACQENKDNHGKVFIANINDTKKFAEITKDIKEQSIATILRFETGENTPKQPKLWHWVPTHLDERISAQKSLFIFGLPIAAEKLNCKPITVEHAAKREIQEALDNIHGIEQASLFPDFSGFANSHRYDAPYKTLTAKDYLKAGNAAYQREEYDQAIKQYDKAIQLDPDDAEAYRGRDIAKAKLGNDAKATGDDEKTIVSSLDDAKPHAHTHARGSNTNATPGNDAKVTDDGDNTIVLSPNDARSHTHTLRGNTNATPGNDAKVTDDGDNTIVLSPNDARPHTHTLRGNTNATPGNDAKVTDDGDNTIVLSLDDAKPHAHAQRGNTYSTLGNDTKAIGNYDMSAISIRPNEAENHYNRDAASATLDKRARAFGGQDKANPYEAKVHYNRGIANAKVGKHEKAIADYDKAIALNPDYAEAYNNRGTAYTKLGKHEKAIADYDKAIALEPNYTAACYNRGTVHNKFGKHEKAIADYDRAVALNPDHTAAYYNRGTAYTKLGKHAKAIADYNKAIVLNPDDADIYSNRGAVYTKLGKHEKAVADYDKAIALNPDDAGIYNNRGTAYTKLGKHKKAIKDYDQAIKLAPDYAEAYRNRGIVKAERGKYAKAIKDYDQAIKLAPDYTEAYRNRGKAKAERGRHKDAKADFEQARDLTQQALDKTTSKHKKAALNIRLQKITTALNNLSA